MCWSGDQSRTQHNEHVHISGMCGAHGAERAKRKFAGAREGREAIAFQQFCPISENLFSQLGKTHSSEIRRAIHKAWKLDSRSFYKEVLMKLYRNGNFAINIFPTVDWQGAFRFAEEWNRYPYVNSDREQLNRYIYENKWRVSKGEIKLDAPTWLTLASLSFHKDAEKESPNHLFLKELLKMYFVRHHLQVKEEVYFKLYGDKVRFDLVGLKDMKDDKDQIEVIGEVGGVQIWKVIALLHKHYKVVVLPHWTKQKINPFIRKKLNYSFYIFEGGKT